MREAELRFDILRVDLRTKRVEDGADFNEVNTKGYVPALRLDNGQVLTENAAVLQYIADRNPAAKLAGSAGSLERYRLQEWLSFVNSEIHKNFSPLFAANASEDAKEFTRNQLAKRLQWLQGAMGVEPFLTGESFTVADSYLFTVLNWAGRVKLDLGEWPALKRFHERVGGRPHVKEALRAEGLLK
jgi:glutathione S-transferase